MERNHRQILTGLALSCLPLPFVLSELVYRAPLMSSVNVFAFSLFIAAVPAIFLLLGYRQVEKSGDFSRSSFIQAGAVVGIVIGLIAVSPLAVPLIYFRGEGVPAHWPMSQLVGILACTSGWGALSASIFWGVAIAPRRSTSERFDSVDR